MSEGKITRRGGGVNVKDATATENDVLQGETFYSVDKDKKTGNIPSKGAETFTPTTSNQTISSGQYLSGTQTILGDSDLVPDNIRDGTTIFGVTGTLVLASQSYLSFDGVDDFVDITNDNIVLDSDWEVNITFLLNGLNKENFLFSFGYNETTSFLIYITEDNELSFINIDNGPVQIENTNFTPNQNQKYELKLKHFNGNQYEYYIDNSLIYSFSMSTPTFNSSNITLGYAIPRNKAGAYFDGNIYFLNIIDNGTTVLEYNFNEGSGTTLNDSVGNNDGTISGATWEQE